MRTHVTSLTTLVLVVLISAIGFAQDFTLEVNSEEHVIADGDDISFSTIVEEFRITVSGGGDTVYELRLIADVDIHLGIFTETGSLTVTGELAGISDLRNHAYQVLDQSHNPVISFDILASGESVSGRDNAGTTEQVTPVTSAIEWISRQYPDLTFTPYGLQLNRPGRLFGGNEFTHIFLDQQGNSLITTIPQGIANRQYIIHVVFQASTDDAITHSYSVNQTAGEYQDNLVFRGVSEPSDFLFTSRVDYYWAETIMALSTSTSDIQFELIQSTYTKSGSTFSGSTERVATRTIRMTSVYTGSFDIGLLNSTLSNPEYSLIPLPADSTQTTVKVTEDGDHGVVTAMVTLYSSPVVWIQRLAGEDIPAYKLYGRNFLDDHEWYQKLFPALGVSIGSSALENLFFGLNFEFTRGGNLFGGLHYGKVSTLDFPVGFVPGQTPMSAEEFNTLHNEEWKLGIAFGFTLDIGIVSNLIGR